MGEWMTLKAIARELGVPESTCRHWRDDFEAFVPSEGTGRRKRYRREAVDVLRSVALLKERQETPEAITAELARLYPVSVEPRTQERRNAAGTQEVTVQAQEDRAVLVALVREVLDSKADRADLAALVERIEAAERRGTQEVETLANADAAKRIAALERRNAELARAIRTLDARTKKTKDQGFTGRLKRAWSALLGKD